MTMNANKGPSFKPDFLTGRLRRVKRTAQACASAALITASASCTTTPVAAQGERSIEDIENEKEPLTDNECLDGEYFDTTTESCEPMEGQTEHDNSHSGAIDVPKDGVFDDEAPPLAEDNLDTDLPPED
jgi:hypothetical protein